MSLPQGTGKSPNQLFNVSVSRNRKEHHVFWRYKCSQDGDHFRGDFDNSMILCFDKILHFSQNSVFLIFSLLLKKNLYFWQNSVFLTKLFVFCGSKNKCSHGGGQVVSTNKAIGVMSAHKGCPPTENSTSPYKCYIFMRTHREDFNIA